MILGFDIDDCITKTTQIFCSYSNQLFNTNLKINLLSTASVKFEDLGLISPKQVVQIKELYYRNRIFRTIDPYEMAISTLKEFQHTTIYFISCRNDYNAIDLLEDTNYWFESHGIKKYDLIFTQNKQSIINKLNLDLFIEDNISEIQKIQKNSPVKIIIPERPWNTRFKNLLHNVTFVEGWHNINRELKMYD